MGSKIKLAALNVISNGALDNIFNKLNNEGKRKREQPQEVQLRKIALAQQKRERKALEKQKKF